MAFISLVCLILVSRRHFSKDGFCFRTFCCLFRKIPLKNRGGRCFFVLRENGDALLCVKTFSTYVIFGHRRESDAFGFSGI